MDMANNLITDLIFEIDRYLSDYDMQGIRDVRSGIASWSGSPMQNVQPGTLPVCAWLTPALEGMADRRLAQAIQQSLPLLKWVTYDSYPRADIGPAFADGHAFASLIGESGFLCATDFDLGLFVIAPNVLYPDHHHAAPELYAPLTGPHGWRFLPDEQFRMLAADVPVWNEPWAPHATRTGSVPFLCIFGWTKNVNIPARIIAGYEVTRFTP
jgi:hypothetical protein